MSQSLSSSLQNRLGFGLQHSPYLSLSRYQSAYSITHLRQDFQSHPSEVVLTAQLGVADFQYFHQVVVLVLLVVFLLALD
mgnify:CR=1 FL=1